MGSQIVRFVVVTSFRRNLAPTNDFSNFSDFYIFYETHGFFIIFNFSYKRSARIELLPPQIYQNPQQPKFPHFPFRHSRARGVAKRIFGIPVLHGTQYFLCFPCSMGSTLFTFATPLQRERRFSYFPDNF